MGDNLLIDTNGHVNATISKRTGDEHVNEMETAGHIHIPVESIEDYKVQPTNQGDNKALVITLESGVVFSFRNAEEEKLYELEAKIRGTLQGDVPSIEGQGGWTYTFKDENAEIIFNKVFLQKDGSAQLIIDEHTLATITDDKVIEHVKQQVSESDIIKEEK